MRRFHLVLALIIIFSASSFSQGKGTWYLANGFHWVDYNAMSDGGDLFKTTNWNGGGLPKWFTVGYGLSKDFSLETGASFANIEKAPFPILNDQYFEWDLNLQYHFCNDYIIRDDFPIEPYLIAGGGLHRLNTTTDPLLKFGLGVNFWTGRHFALNWQSTYETALDFEDYLHHALAFKVRFNGKKDTDGDGIVDSKDKCPTVPGTREADGCPDRDGDGLGDLFDKCPDVAGPKENMGCPLIDETQRKEIDDQIRFAAKNIFFETSSDVIMQESYDDLDNIVNIMNKFPTSRFAIEGHTDNTGGTDLNQKLSDKRAQAVKKYFIGKGIAESRLDARGYGETKPLATNDTPEGRAVNRRVEIKIISR